MGLFGQQDLAENGDSKLGNSFTIRLPAGKPFENVHLQLKIRADLIHHHQQTKDGATIEHRVSTIYYRCLQNRAIL